jgi:ribosomal protein L37AE/L43A
MGKFLKEFLWRASFVVIGALLGPIVYNFIGQQYPEFIRKQPRWLLSIIFLVVIFLFFLFGIIHRRAVIRISNLEREVPDFDISPMGSEGFGLLKYKGVGWEVEFPKPFPSYDPFSRRDPKEHLFEVELDRIKTCYSPLCPECSSPLKERDSFFGLHIWKCKKCAFKKRSIKSFGFESKMATLKAREEFKKIKIGLASDNMILYEEYQKLFPGSSRKSERA